MNLVSTDNSFYRYNIEVSRDISESTFLRRQTKARQNNKRHFIFDLSPKFDGFDLLPLFLKEKSSDGDLILIRPQDLRFLADQNPCLLKISSPSELELLCSQALINSKQRLLFSPLTLPDFKALLIFSAQNSEQFEIFWSFVPYNPAISHSLTVADIVESSALLKPFPGLEILNTSVPSHYELEPIVKSSYNLKWSFQTPAAAPLVSIIIPSFNSSLFLSNVVWHLVQQSFDRNKYEVIIIDDGSSDQSAQILQQLFEKYKSQFNIKYIYWSKEHPTRGEQNFFRPGLARNLASRYSSGKYLFFLDSDMLVPPDFVETVIASMQENDLIQFQRFHIHQELSRKNPTYAGIDLNKHTYIEEKQYWSELFFADNWSSLPFHWKYTCTYALGLTKENFQKLGLFKKYYVSYGFEDTDLGYEAHKRNLKFALIKKPLLHLTSYDLMQYKNSSTKRFELLKKTAELFYLQHLDPEIYSQLGNFYRMQKPLKSLVRDFSSRLFSRSASSKHAGSGSAEN